MPKCFLSFSSAYGELKEPFRRLLEAVGFDKPVDVFDGPELDAVPDVVLQKIRNADAVVILYGPKEKPEKGQKALEPAKWPYEEALLARGMQKPIIMVIHQGTPLPEALTGYASHARFDFWDRESFLQNIHHVVKHLLDHKERLGHLSEKAAFKYRKATVRYRIQSRDCVKLEVYHEVVARHSCSVFEHSIDTAGDQTATLPLPQHLEYRLLKRKGPDAAQLSIRFGPHTPHEIEYFVEVKPSLEPGQELGYWRSFLVPNTYPLTRADIAERAGRTGYPTWFPPNTYGNSWDVVYDIETISQTIYFPREFPIANYGVRVLHYKTREENLTETERCKPFVQPRDNPEDPEIALEMNVPYPLMNHSYFLLYEPKI